MPCGPDLGTLLSHPPSPCNEPVLKDLLVEKGMSQPNPEG